ncbi:MAG: 4'-phosphopantetheinyl transferase, partial [Gammaproteobacteria bacterium]|nr:4'-phosphopantetheinyl transferase [Gammaproteobacteria bacterium]
MSLLSLSNQHIDIWLIEPSKINDTELLAQYQSLITSDELTRVKRYLREKDQHSALITRIFVRCVLAHYADIAPSDWLFGKGFNGKPFVKNQDVNLEFNLSHA